MAEKFGKTWWGQKWLQSLNNIDYSNRLPRGSTYARKGYVTKIKIQGNHIDAFVQGSRMTPYKVQLKLPEFSGVALNDFIDKLAEKPLLISKLFNRELDPTLLTFAEKNGLKIFPKQWSDIEMNCNCPDWAVPCKHLAAVIYKISAEIDNNPFLAFELHKVDLISELTNRGLYLDTSNAVVEPLSSFYLKDQKVKQAPRTFDSNNAYEKLSYASLIPLDQALMALLSEYPVFYNGSGDFKTKYLTTLNRIVRNAKRILDGKIELKAIAGQYQENKIHVNPHAVIEVFVDENLEAFIQVDCSALTPMKLIVELEAVQGTKLLDYQPSTASLYTVLQLALHLIANGAVTPQIVMLPNQKYAIRWLPAMISKDVRQLVDKLAEVLPPDILCYWVPKKQEAIQQNAALNLLSIFLTPLIHELSGKESSDFFHNFFFKNNSYSFTDPGEGGRPGGIQTWLQKFYLNQGVYKPQVVVSETPNDDFLIEVNVLNIGQDPVSLKQILSLKKFDKSRLEILQTLSNLIDFLPGLENYVNSKGKEKIVLDIRRFTPFLFQMIPAIRLLDIDILLPKSLQNILKPKSTVKVSATKGKSFIQLDKLFDFSWQVALGDTIMSEEEFKKLLIHSDTLLKFKSEYIYVSQADLEKLHKHFSKENHTLSSFEVLRAALSGEYQGAKVALDNQVIKLIKQLSQIEQEPLPKGLHAQLRPYQHSGYSWIYRNAKIGFGSVIADDMGLGKTLQVITTMLKYKEEGLLDDKKILVIVPTGLIANWLSEIDKFAPSLKVALFHGSSRKIPDSFDMLLTSYGVARSDAAKLKKLPWYSVIIDEAQNIKNQQTAQTKAIKSIKADNFIAMSGTPVENRLSELWSIMDFSNRGVLGKIKDFQDNFSKPIEIYNDSNVADKLKKISAPFLLRRLKTDKSIISDLPDKIEMDSYGYLVAQQASLYEKTLEAAMNEIENIDPSDKKKLFARQGLVLQMILALKQICNHPSQYLKDKNMDSTLSGKLDLLFEKLDSIVNTSEKVLIFTQFREMGELLQHFIAERYGESPMFYHGGCSLKQRTQMVKDFQDNPADKIFILSLKAAGTGLNLTAANHVIHYDLWWNPAVEAQATDRAYRIGQKKNVMVHRLITKNTFEERINAMINSKKALAEMTVSTGENWIGNLSNKELKDLFTLG